MLQCNWSAAAGISKLLLLCLRQVSGGLTVWLAASSPEQKHAEQAIAVSVRTLRLVYVGLVNPEPLLALCEKFRLMHRVCPRSASTASVTENNYVLLAASSDALRFPVYL